VSKTESRLRVLFVCALNQWRSPTAENLYRNHPALEVRSAGVRKSAKRRLGLGDIKWADVIFVMDQEHKTWIREEFQGEQIPQTIVLDIPGNFTYMDPELQRLLRLAIDPELASLLQS
jgi:predicted protein tyrosine phosphatase